MQNKIFAQWHQISHTTIIFPNNEPPFSTKTPRLPDPGFQEMVVWFGFHCWVYHSNDSGEYGFIGGIHKWAGSRGVIGTGTEILKAHEWFEPRHNDIPLKRYQRICF